MTIIHLVDGEKGGVGKSFVTKTMIQYGLDRQFSFVAVETDRSNPDVSRVYRDLCQFAVFSEDEKQANLEQAEAIRSNMEAVSQKYIASMKQVGMDSTSAIADAHSENWSQAQRTQRQNEELFESIKILRAEAKADRQEYVENMNALIAWVNKTTQKQEAVNQETNNPKCTLWRVPPGSPERQE